MNSEYTKKLYIAELMMELEIGKLAIPEEMQKFLWNKEDEWNADIRIGSCQINKQEYTNLEKGSLVLSSHFLKIYESDMYYSVFYEKPELLYGYRVYKEEAETILYMMEDDGNYYDTAHILLEKNPTRFPSGPELLLYSIRDAFFFHAQKFGRLAIHSASIVYLDRVWLFSAPSGTGKSTHVGLWHEMGYPIDDFNGDVCMCYEKEGKVKAAGLPWCGTSGIYKNKVKSLGGILFLKRGEQDLIQDMSSFEAAIHVNARSVSPNWTRELVSCNLSIVESLVPKIYCGILCCTKETSAAICVKEKIDQYMQELSK